MRSLICFLSLCFSLAATAQVVFWPNLGLGVASAAGTGLWDGLTHYWRLEETAGNNRADAIGAETFTEIGGTVSSGTGINGNCVVVTTGSTHYLEGTGAFPAATALTINLWVKSALPSTAFGFLRTDGDSDPAFSLFNIASLTDVCVPAYMDVPAANNCVDITANTWQMITFTWDGASVKKLGQNGAVSAFTDANLIPGGASVLILGDPGGASSVNYSVDEIGLWSRVLSSSEISQLWNSGTGQFPP